MFSRKPCFMIVGVVTVLLAHHGVAQDVSEYSADWVAIGPGGGVGAGGGVVLNCTIGQAVAGNGAGGEYTLLGGYQVGATGIAAPGDCDRNGVVQLNDFACFENCFTGAGREALVECASFDLDSDGDVDGSDYASFSAQFGN